MDHFTNTARERFAQRLLKSRRAIVINDALMHGLGYESTRDFFRELGDWGHCKDFGELPEAADVRVQSYLRAFIRDNFIN